MRARWAPVLLVTAGLIAGGCGSSDDPVREPGQGSDAPRQVPALVAPDSPGAAIRRLWTLIAKGAVPPAVDAYAPRVRRGTGVSALAGGLTDAAFRLRSLREPVVIQRLNTSRGALITVVAAARQEDDPAFRGTFLMQRIGRRWLVVYDTLMAESITAYVTNFVQSSVKPGARPGARAAAAGLRAADRFRTALFRRGELTPARR